VPDKRSIGNVKNLGNDRYRLRVSAGFDDYGRRIQISRTVDATSDRAAEEALMKLYREKSKLSEKRIGEAPKILDTLWREFKDNYVSTLRLSTRDFYTGLWEAHIEKYGKARLNGFSPKMVYGILNECKSGPRTKKGIYGLLRTVFSKAIDWGYMTENPCKKVKSPKYKAAEKSIYDEKQLVGVVAFVEREDIIYRAFFYFAAMCGMRRGEIMGLRWADLDLDTRTIEIKQAAGKAKKIGTYYGETKTKKSVRKLTLPETLVPILKALRADQSRAKLRLAERWIDTPYLFKGWNGEPLNVDAPTRWWKRFIAAHPEISGPTFHALRHMAATLLIKNNVSISTVSGILGHAQMSTTVNIYTHVIEDAKKDALGTLEAAITGKKNIL